MATPPELLHIRAVQSAMRNDAVSRLKSVKYQRNQWVVAGLAALGLMVSSDSAASQTVRREDVRKMVLMTGVRETSVISSRGGFAVAITRPGVRNANGVVEGVQLHGETLDAETAQLLGFSSMTSKVDVDCPRRRNQVMAMTTYAEPTLKGAREEREVPGGWIQPSPQAYLADVLRSVCGLKPNSALQVASLDDDKPVAISERQGRPALRPSIGLNPATPQPPPAPPPQPVAAKPKAEAPPRKPGKVIAQVGAVPSESAARDLLKKVARHAPAGTTQKVEEASVDGRTLYRAQVRGFVDRPEAKRFCNAVTTAGGVCFVR